ncbi:GspH/FimT family pseudopilin [Salinimonas sediminis]|uniref:Type II secretion system protein H n=1 Tax=Salinimonas sediminis TaxID=2303538 RepID=A0A346NNV8_9ALTE|nr:GspH/FimT family pseudopilin [Salinimonas sediminis]AXR07215.1 prepilin-type N-terminal cleavage/methylation domain-containing protein [Salinimonas sediminis]
MAKTINKQRGLTLVELMITIAIAAILMTIGAPGISSMLQQNRIIADINNLSAVARAARFSAVDEGSNVVLCPTKDYNSCTGSWQEGKMAFIDSNSNGNRENGEAMIAAVDQVSGTSTVSGISGTLTFRPDGSISNQAAIVVCPTSGDAKQASALILSLFGRIAVAVDSNDDGIKENAAGANISCS